ncbi:MAG TPA: UpxY family transcription antiterminator [Luteibaculaceae bacterium]|nr:UpxY family transcription antiterminator [Luteibaculaceae bacterium]
MAIYTKPRNEKKVADRLARQGFEVYLPLHEQKRKWSDRYKTVKVPIISSYVFLRITEKERNAVLQDPGVLNFVFYLGKPARITDEEIQRIKFVLNEAGSDMQIELTTLAPGALVTITEGPFSGQQAQVLHTQKRKISVTLPSLGLVITLSPLHTSLSL